MGPHSTHTRIDGRVPFHNRWDPTFLYGVTVSPGAGLWVFR